MFSCHWGELHGLEDLRDEISQLDGIQECAGDVGSISVVVYDHLYVRSSSEYLLVLREYHVLPS